MSSQAWLGIAAVCLGASFLMGMGITSFFWIGIILGGASLLVEEYARKNKKR